MHFRDTHPWYNDSDAFLNRVRRRDGSTIGIPDRDVIVLLKALTLDVNFQFANLR
jgi:hypothetical protein